MAGILQKYHLADGAETTTHIILVRRIKGRSEDITEIDMGHLVTF
jgi:hypothetical protein